jgi:hypothetical protein
MPRRRVGRLLALLGLAALAWGLASSAARAQGCATCATPYCSGGQCQVFHCPPWYHHCQERPPIICIKFGCPRPVCNPCGLPNFGYYPTCWTPWPLPPNWGHCPITPPAAYVQLAGPLAYPGAPNTGPSVRMQTPPGAIAPPPGGAGQPSALPPLSPLEEHEQFPTPRPMVPGPTPGKLAP